MSGKNEKLKQLAEKLKAHPQYSANPQVRAIIDEYRLRLLDPALSSIEMPNVLKALQGSLKDYSEWTQTSVESIFPGLHLREQYESQIAVARRSGLFEEIQAPDSKGIFSSMGLPVIVRENEGKSGTNYSMPAWSEVRLALIRNKEVIKAKADQGFTQMLIVPFGYDLKTMAEKFKDKVRELDQAGLNPDGSDNPERGIFGAGGDKVEFDREDANYPVYISEGWDESQMVYYPKEFDKENHGGITKEDAIEIKGAWQICFVEDMPVIPLEGEKKGGRKQLGRNGNWIAGQTGTPEIREFKKALNDIFVSDKYRHERGMTPEKYLWMQLTSLLAKEEPILMDYAYNEYRGTHLMECLNVSSSLISFGIWSRDPRLMSLGGNASDAQDEACGVRSSVDLK